MDPRPHLLAAELEHLSVALEQLAPAVGCHGHGDQGVVDGFEAADGDVALEKRVLVRGFQSMGGSC